MSMAILALSPEHTLELGRALGLAAEPGDVILLTGELGAGKTQFTKGVALALGVERPITSPTFNLIYEYPDRQGTKTLLRHFDLYRLEKEEELDDIDYFGLLEDNVVSVVEWGDKFPGALPNDYLLIELECVNETTRSLHCRAAGSGSAALLELFEKAAVGSGFIAQGVPDGMSNGMSNGTSNGMLGGMSDGATDGMLDRTSDRMLDGTPDEL